MTSTTSAEGNLVRRLVSLAEVRFRLCRETYMLLFGILLCSITPILSCLILGRYKKAVAVTFNSIFRGDSAWDDSWAPIGNVLRYLASHSPEGLYQATYWESSHQFIYSPLSIVFYKMTNWPPILDWLSPLSVNRLFWWILWGDVALVILIFNEFYRHLDLPTANRNPYERIARVFLPLLAALLYFPLMWGYWVGNIQTGLTFLTLLSLYLWLRGDRIGVGVCLGVVCIFKPAIAPILLWALLRREFRMVGGFLAVLIPIGIASLFMFGVGVHRDYLELMAYLSRRGESYFGSHSINSLLNRLIFNGPNLVWDGTHSHILYVPWIHYATMITTFCFIGAALIGRRQHDPVASWIDYAIAILSFTIGSPVVYEHHLGFTIVLFMMAGLMLLKNPRSPILMLSVLGASYLAIGNSLEIITDRLAGTSFNFLQSYRLFGTIGLLAILYHLRSMRSEQTAIAAEPS